ncbi:MAG: hypothetical protein JWQ40_1863 [Segetibacter sp.]|nr:hypothetical protein [Segetibacter sp.]
MLENCFDPLIFKLTDFIIWAANVVYIIATRVHFFPLFQILLYY